MPASVIVRTDEELREQRQALLNEAGMTYEQLQQCAEEWALSEHELSLWNTIQGIDFLLGNE
ncbi:hypothetical protein [Streptomonospora salina]|uniref:Antitoxin component of RelBE/YafQ-DinJ toxin-antitoxin module n=1 Tax=Streptomonospora salina TaxID=104205 RepID=A0A841EC59_9ACTN|nr:hypothetical protein [Streptomonospora salina]MBB5998060.1 antitoxin component of RelBE/YafQ-DinJ toxin-antitoxin module [Streptomonospora salina]